MIYVRGALLAAGLLLIGLSYLPGCDAAFPAGAGVCFLALGMPLLEALD